MSDWWYALLFFAGTAVLWVAVLWLIGRIATRDHIRYHTDVTWVSKGEINRIMGGDDDD